MSVVLKSFKTVRNKFNFSLINSNRFKSILSYVDLPFYFDSLSKGFYRFDASICNFSYEHVYKNFVLSFGLNLKDKMNMLMPFFINYSSSKVSWHLQNSRHHVYLFENSFVFSSINIYSKFKQFQTYKDIIDYFPTNSYEFIINSLYDLSYQLDDVAFDNSLLYNKFHKIVQNSRHEIDTFVSTFNSN